MIKTNRYSILVLLSAIFFFSPSISLSADSPTVYGGSVIFNNPAYDSVALVEFPFSLRRHELTFFQPDSTNPLLISDIYAQVNLINVAGMSIDSVSTSFVVGAANSDEAKAEGYQVFNKLSMFVPPGIYSAQLTVVDQLSQGKTELFLGKLIVEPSVTGRIVQSETITAYRIRQVGDDSSGINARLIKNEFEVIPNPLSIFSVDDSLLYVYTEVYNMEYSDTAPSSYRLSVVALDEDSIVYRNFGGRVTDKQGSTTVIVESFEIDSWSTGFYFIRQIVTDLDNSLSDTAMIPFRIVSPEELIAEFVETDTFDPYDTLSLEQKEHLVAYLLTPDQKTIISRLTDEGRNEYFKQYWREHDEDPFTQRNETRLKYLEWFGYANRYFSSDMRRTDGWLSDRGRIYLTYGPYDRIDDRQAPRNDKPFQVWYYFQVKEGKFFIFEDDKGMDDYQLVHSNVMSEIYNQLWQDKIEQGIIDVDRF